MTLVLIYVAGLLGGFWAGYILSAERERVVKVLNWGLQIFRDI